MRRRLLRGAVVMPLIALMLAACTDDTNVRVARELTGGDPVRGRQLLVDYGCAACHTIPGVLQATATVGPPLSQIALRTYLAGRIQNTPDNMMNWIRNPRGIDEKTAMPNTGVTEHDSRDIAAYLYTLR